MSKKGKTGKCRPSRKSAFGTPSAEIRLPCVIIGAACASLVGLAVMLLSGPPYIAVRILGLNARMLPVWLNTLLGALCLALGGGACGAVIGYCRRGKSTEKYRGGIFFVASLTLFFLWYKLLFGSLFLFFALILLLGAIVLGFFCAKNFFSVVRLAGIAFLALEIFWIYLFVTGLITLFSL